MKHILIVGGGFAGWYTAAALRHHFPELRITVVDSAQHHRLGVGETLPFSAPYDWKKLLGLKDDRMLMWRTGAVYKYGTTARNFWSDDSFFSHGKFFNLKIKSLVHFYNEFDYPDFHEHWNDQPGDVGTQQAWLSINQRTNKNIHDYIEEQNDAQHFTTNPVAPYDRNNRYILRSTDGYSYQIDAEQAVTFFKELAFIDTSFTSHISRAVKSVKISDNGAIDSVLLENGQEIRADLFIDASGGSRALVSRSSNQSWKTADPDDNNSAWVCPTRYESPERELIGATTFFGEQWGWRFKIGLYHRAGNGYIFNSNIVDKQIPLEHLLAITSNRLAEPKFIQWTPGWYQEPWQHNLLAIGISAHLVDPFDAPTFDIHSQSLHALIAALKIEDQAEARHKYNQDHQLVVEERNLRLRFAFGLTRKTGDYWDSRRALLERTYDMRDLYEILAAEKSSLQTRLPHWWQTMYYKFAIAAGVDRSKMSTVTLTPQDEEMVRAFFQYTRSRNAYIRQQTWPNYYEWLKTNRFNGQTSQQVLERLHPNLA